MKWWVTYTNLPVNAIVRLPHLRTGDRHGQKMVLASSADNQTRNYNTECLNHHPSLSTPRSKGLSHNKMKWWATYTNLPVNAIVRLPHLRTGGRYGQKMVLATSANNQIRNYNTECSNHHPSLSTPRSKGLSHSKVTWWASYKYKFSSKWHNQTTPSSHIYIYIYIYRFTPHNQVTICRRDSI